MPNVPPPDTDPLPAPAPIELLPAAGRPAQLMILLHGRGQQAADLLPLARAFRAQFPQAALLLPQGFDAYDGSAVPPDAALRQWMAGSAAVDEGLPERVAAALPRLARWVRAVQQRLGATPQETALVGFSQGALMALELAAAEDGIAGRVLAFGGRYARLPARAPRLTTLHFFHGGADTVHAADYSRRAIEHLGVLHGDATLDIAEGVGHELHPALVDCALHRLTHHIPHRTWQAALGMLPRDAAPDDDD